MMDRIPLTMIDFVVYVIILPLLFAELVNWQPKWIARVVLAFCFFWVWFFL